MTPLFERKKTPLLYCFLGSLFFLLTACRQVQMADEAFEPPAPSQGFRQESTSQRAFGQPRHVALLLPQSGKNAPASKAIQEGFLASYYASQGLKPVVRVYDTTKERDVRTVYDQAVNEGADFVVGPLAKEDVQRLSTASLKAPVLALNHHPAAKASSQFMQFSLSPEAEAEQLAQKAKQRGFNRAAVIVQDNAWGKRIAQAFSRRWQSLGGQTVTTVYANPTQDQSIAVRRLLGIELNQPKHAADEKIDFKALRRQDIDVIVMAATPDQGRQLKPLFDFYYADDIPVFATSSIYSGIPNPRKDRDLNGVIFCDMPWLLDSQRGNTVRQLLQRNQGGSSEQYNRLFAMGVDAYQLCTRIAQLQSQGAYMGTTGNLRMNDHYQIERSLAWAKMVDGAPVALR